MRYRKLGNTGLIVSEMCLGAMTFGSGEGMWATVAGVGQESVTDLIKAALDRGINFIDTADFYSNGRSEVVGDGSSNAPSLGSIAIATSPALSRDELSARPARRPQTLILHRRGYLLLGTNCGSGVSGKPRVQIVPPATVTPNVPSTCCMSRRASPTPCRLVSAAAGA